MITSNIIDGDGYGIWLRCSGNNKIINNVLVNCFAGIYFQMSDEIGSGGNFLRYNTMVNCGFMIRGSTLSDYINDIDVSNTINGKPIYYYINETNGFVPSDAGEVFLIDCDYFVVSNIIFNEGNMCVTLAYSNFNTIEAIKDNSDGEGLYLDSSNENLIQNNHNISFEMVNSDNNNIINNSCEGLFLTESSGNNINSNFISKDYAGNGIYLYRNSDYNNIVNNIIKLNQSSYGITLGSDENSNNIIKENTIKNAIIGLRIYTSSNDNEIYHNSFFNNTQNAYDECINNWDNGYPSGGNYWDDYNGTDAIKDGIGDTPYSILGGNNQDQYPLMLPYGMTNLTITFVLRPFKSLISIKNVGSTTALNVHWSLTFKGGFLICKREYSGTVKPLLPDEEITLHPRFFFFGLGTIEIDISSWADNAPINTEKIYGHLLLFFFILIP